MLLNLTIAVYLICSTVLIIFGLHHYAVIGLFLKAKKTIHKENEEVETAHKIDEDNAPAVLVQIPLYNEYNVAERIIETAAALDYPNLEIQILDDSNDKTVEHVDEIVERLQGKGINIQAVRREDRSGYKAGALAYGMTLSDANYIAIFDSDFVPEADFLRKTIPHLEGKPECGLVQARWDHLNAEDSAFTRAQSVGIDGHFIVEQVARAYNDYLLNFNGTAGVWRRQAIDDAGGWSSDTLTEDLDLSYRAQLKGWKFHYLPDVCVPAELPPTYNAFRSQQFRWAKGSMQTAKKLLPIIWFSDQPFKRKIEATFHLTHYSIHLCMLAHAILGLPIALAETSPFAGWLLVYYMFPMGLAMLGPSLLYLAAELYISKDRFMHFLTRLPMLLFVGFGICLSNARACIEGLIGVKSAFVRTPKSGDKKTTETVNYRVKRSVLPRLEILFCLYSVATALIFIFNGLPSAAPFFVLYAIGFGTFGINSLLEERA